MRLAHFTGGLLCIIGAALLMACASTSAPDPQLQQADDLLRAKQYDQVDSVTTDYLKRNATGEGAATAWYLRGRAFDERPKPTPAAVGPDLQKARTCYIQALGLVHADPLEANIRNDLANVAYQQDDYAVAEQQWLLASAKFTDPTSQAWAIYRAGVCRQRLGRFADADAIFVTVQQKFPNTEPAKRSREHQGARGFYVQVAAVASSAAGDSIVAAVRKLGIIAITLPPKPGQNLFTVVVGPHNTYAQAEATKRQLAAQYPDAVIVP